jgi:hypothetical protein
MSSKKKPTGKRLQRVSVRAELRDEPDWDRFAYALLQYVKLTSAQKDKATKQKRKSEAS